MKDTQKMRVAGPPTRINPETLHGAPILRSCYGWEIRHRVTPAQEV